MILSTLIISIILRQSLDEPGRVAAFVRSARTGIEGDVVQPPFPRAGERPKLDSSFNEPERESDCHLYQFAESTIFIEIATGHIQGYNDNSRNSENFHNNHNEDGSLKPRRITDEQAFVLAGRFFNAAGWPGKIEAIPRWRNDQSPKVLDGQGYTDESLEMLLVPSFSGVHYDEGKWQVVVQINRQTGQLQKFSYRGFIPTPPLDVTPRFSLDAARLIALREAGKIQGGPLKEWAAERFKLQIWYPTPNNDLPDVSLRKFPKHVREAVDAKRGVLCYVGVVAGSTYDSGILMVIDATTGAVLEATHPFHQGQIG